MLTTDLFFWYVAIVLAVITKALKINPYLIIISFEPPPSPLSVSLFSHTHTKLKSYFWGIAFHQTWKRFSETCCCYWVFQWETTVSIHLKFYAAVLRKKLLWFSKYLCISSVVSIKGMRADIKAPSWIVSPWQPWLYFPAQVWSGVTSRNEPAKPYEVHNNPWLGLAGRPGFNLRVVVECLPCCTPMMKGWHIILACSRKMFLGGFSVIVRGWAKNVLLQTRSMQTCVSLIWFISCTEQFNYMKREWKFFVCLGQQLFLYPRKQDDNETFCYPTSETQKDPSDKKKKQF